MRILIVASIKKTYYAPFIIEQANSIIALGHTIEYFGVNGSGINGYLKNLSSLKNKIKQFKPDIIHAHYGLSGLLACLQRSVPVVVTYHGSDINVKSVRVFSKIAMCLSAYNIFVSQKNIDMAKARTKYTLIPCGIDLDLYKDIIDKQKAMTIMQWQCEINHILFAGAFNNDVKNYPLAHDSIKLLNNIEIHELKGFSRKEVIIAMYAADCLLMTSHTEGSPQVIKEAMACGCPIVSVDVGDVKDIINGIDGCYIAERNPENIAEKIKLAMDFGQRTKGIERIIELNLDNKTIAKQLIKTYQKLL